MNRHRSKRSCPTKGQEVLALKFHPARHGPARAGQPARRAEFILFVLKLAAYLLAPPL